MTQAIKYDNFQYYTYDDYKQWEDRWELIYGIAYAMAPAPYPVHQRIASKIWRELDKSLECEDKQCEVYISPVDWKISDNTVVQPDVAIFCEESDLQYFSKTPPLIVEVLSKATALKDVTTKFYLYEKQGVEYYIIIEPNTQIADIFKLQNGEYALQKKATKEDSYLFEMNECKVEVDFGLVFE
ncbi:MAG: Uma2 family endonuclease [Campylobacterales bacterium]|nr:Uma2 family endonuclease [Campylobacterales bacterium]